MEDHCSTGEVMAAICGAGISLGRGEKMLFNWVYCNMLQILLRWLNQYFIFTFNSFLTGSIKQPCQLVPWIKIDNWVLQWTLWKELLPLPTLFCSLGKSEKLWALVKIVVLGWEQALLPQFWFIILYIPTTIMLFYWRTLRCRATDKNILKLAVNSLGQLGSCCCILDVPTGIWDK